MRTREIALESWRLTLKELLNKYLQVKDYMSGESIVDYSDLINITFNEYTNPTLENITNVLAKQVQTGLKSQITAIKELNKGISEEQAIEEYEQILAEQQPNQMQNEMGNEETSIPQYPQMNRNQRITLTQIPVN